MKEYNIVDMKSFYQEKLYQSLCVASCSHSYSLCIEYMKEWFIKEFPPNYFKSIYIDGKNVLDDYKNMTTAKFLRREKPSLAIQPQIDLAYDRDNIDLYEFGKEVYASRSKFNNSFLRDPNDNIYLGMAMSMISMNFNFRVRVNTRAQQLDLFKFMRLSFRVGATQGKDVAMDFNIPYNLIIQLAKDKGFFIDNNNQIKDVHKFLRYLNSHSQFPFIYKLRCINGRNEFFIRIPEIYVHIAANDLTADDGDREGQTMTNFVLEMQATVRFPAPNFFSYYSKHQHIELTDKGIITSPLIAYSVKILNVPEYNEREWFKLLETQYEDSEAVNNILNIDFSDFFERDLKRVINETIESKISPELFIDIKVYNDTDILDGYMDWESFTYHSKSEVKSFHNFIAIYIDMDYYNNRLKEFQKMSENRIV